VVVVIHPVAVVPAAVGGLPVARPLAGKGPAVRPAVAGDRLPDRLRAVPGMALPGVRLRVAATALPVVHHRAVPATALPVVRLRAVPATALPVVRRQVVATVRPQAVPVTALLAFRPVLVPAAVTFRPALRPAAACLLDTFRPAFSQLLRVTVLLAVAPDPVAAMARPVRNLRPVAATDHPAMARPGHLPAVVTAVLPVVALVVLPVVSPLLPVAVAAAPGRRWKR